VAYSAAVQTRFGIINHQGEETLGKFCFWAPWVSIALNVLVLYVMRK
jgi:hypothetical protein